MRKRNLDISIPVHRNQRLHNLHNVRGQSFLVQQPLHTITSYDSWFYSLFKCRVKEENRILKDHGLQKKKKCTLVSCSGFLVFIPSNKQQNLRLFSLPLTLQYIVKEEPIIPHSEAQLELLQFPQHTMVSDSKMLKLDHPDEKVLCS